MSAAVSALASSVLALVFAWAGLAKAVRVARWRQDLTRFRLPRALRVSAFLVLPWLELSVVIALVAGAPKAGAAVGLGLMLAFSLAILRARLMQPGNRLGCGCFGNTSVLDYRIMLLRNAAIAALLAFVLASRTGRDGAQAGPGRFPPEGVRLPVSGFATAGRSRATFLRARHHAHRAGPLRQITHIGR